jgi:hypothetical protein
MASQTRRIGSGRRGKPSRQRKDAERAVVVTASATKAFFPLMAASSLLPDATPTKSRTVRSAGKVGVDEALRLASVSH